jgi:type VI secretion system Hcp family effector
MAGNMFLLIDGPKIEGGTGMKGHEGEIEVLNWACGAHQPSSPTRSHGGGGTIEQVTFAPITYTKVLDSASTDLFKMCCSGKHIDSMTLTCYRADGDTGSNQIGVQYLKIVTTSNIVQDYNLSGGDGMFPMENLTVTFAKIEFTYTGMDHHTGGTGGAKPWSYDLKSGVIE